MPVIITNPFEGKRAIPSDNRLQFRIASTTNTLNVIPETELNEMNFPVRYIASGSTGYSWSIHNVSDVEQSGVMQEIHPTGKIPSAPGGTSEFDEGVDNYFGDDVTIASTTAPLSLSDYKIVNGYVNVNLDFDEATVYGKLQNYTDANKKFDFKFNYVGGYNWSTWTGMTGIAVRDFDKPHSEKTFGSRKDFIFEFLPGTAPLSASDFFNQLSPNSGQTLLDSSQDFTSDGTNIEFNLFFDTEQKLAIDTFDYMYDSPMSNVKKVIGNFDIRMKAFNNWENLEYLQIDNLTFFNANLSQASASTDYLYMFGNLPKLKNISINTAGWRRSFAGFSSIGDFMNAWTGVSDSMMMFSETPVSLKNLYIDRYSYIFLYDEVSSNGVDFPYFFPLNFFANINTGTTKIITCDIETINDDSIHNFVTSGGTILNLLYPKTQNIMNSPVSDRIVRFAELDLWKDTNSFWELDTSGNYFSGSQNSYFEGIELNVTSPNPTGFTSQDFLYPGLHYFLSIDDLNNPSTNYITKVRGREIFHNNSAITGFYGVEGNGTQYDFGGALEYYRQNGAQCIFRLSGSNSESLFLSQDQYKFLIELYINGNLHSTHEIFSKPGEPAFFDASTIAKSVTPKALIPSQPIDNTYSNSTVQIKVREMIGDTLIEEYATSEVIDIWKGRLDEQQFNLFDYREHTLLPATTGVTFLTDYPRHEKRSIKRNDNFYGGFLATNLLASYKQNLKLKFATYDENMVETGFIMGSCLPVWNNNLGERIKVGTFNLYSELWLNLPENSGATMTQQNVDDASFMSIMQYYSGFTGTKSGETLVYELMDEDCNLGRTIHWMNKYGVMETFYFVKEMDEETDIDSHKIEKGAFNFDLINNGEYDYLKTARDFITLRTDYLPEDVYNWLIKEVIESPLILIDIDGVQYRANVESDKWEAKTHRHNKIFFWEVKFQLSNVRYSPLVG